MCDPRGMVRARGRGRWRRHTQLGDVGLSSHLLDKVVSNTVGEDIRRWAGREPGLKRLSDGDRHSIIGQRLCVTGVPMELSIVALRLDVCVWGTAGCWNLLVDGSDNGDVGLHVPIKNELFDNPGLNSH